MSEIHRDRELEHLQSMLYSYKVENKSMDTENESLKQDIRRLLAEIARLEHEKRSASLDWMAAAGQYEDEIARLRFENAKLLEEAQHELMYGYDMASADYRGIVEQQDREISQMREALVKIARGTGDPVMVAYAALGGEND